MLARSPSGRCTQQNSTFQTINHTSEAPYASIQCNSVLLHHLSKAALRCHLPDKGKQANSLSSLPDCDALGTPPHAAGTPPTAQEPAGVVAALQLGTLKGSGHSACLRVVFGTAQFQGTAKNLGWGGEGLVSCRGLGARACPTSQPFLVVFWARVEVSPSQQGTYNPLGPAASSRSTTRTRRRSCTC